MLHCGMPLVNHDARKQPKFGIGLLAPDICFRIVVAENRLPVFNMMP
jgi:hypothetical protein